MTLVRFRFFAPYARLTVLDILSPSEYSFSGNAQFLYSEGARLNEKLHPHFEAIFNHYPGLGASLLRSTEPQTEKFVQGSQNECFNVYACQGQGFDEYRGVQTDRYTRQRHMMKMGNFFNDNEPTSKKYANTFINLMKRKEQPGYYLS